MSSLNYIEVAIHFNYDLQREEIHVINITKDITEVKNCVYVALTDDELKLARNEELYAAVRFIYDCGSVPSSVILVRDGDECDIGSSDDEWCLDGMIDAWYYNSDSE